VDQKIAALLGAAPADITVTDLVVHWSRPDEPYAGDLRTFERDCRKHLTHYAMPTLGAMRLDDTSRPLYAPYKYQAYSIPASAEVGFVGKVPVAVTRGADGRIDGFWLRLD